MIPVCIAAIENDDDREFMTNLYLDTERILYYEIRALVSDPWAVEDILQDSIVRVIDKIPTLRQMSRRKQYNYLITTVRNQAKNYLRTKSRSRTFAMDDESFIYSQTASDADTLEESIFQKLRAESLRAVWPRLPENTRQLLERKYILGQNDAEIAADLGIKAESVRMKLTRARKDVKSLLESEQNGE